MSDSFARYMLFSLCGQRYAVAAEEVAEIAEMLPAYPIPFAPRFLHGIVNIHGKLAAVLDLALFTGAGIATHGNNLLLLTVPGAALALIVDQMERIISSEEILSEEEGKGALEKARFMLIDGPVTLLDVNAVLDGVEGVLER